MTIYLVSVVYWFLMIVEVAVTVYIFVSWLPLSPTLRKLMNYIMDPLLEPIRRLKVCRIYSGDRSVAYHSLSADPICEAIMSGAEVTI